MSFKESWRREKYVAIHAQTWRFRVVKYLVLITLMYGVHQFYGWSGVGMTLGVLTVLALAIHFIFRWKTEAWTKSWGPYKKIDIPE